MILDTCFLIDLQRELRDRRDRGARNFLRNMYSGRAQALEQLVRAAEAVKDWERAGVLDDGRRRLYYESRRALAQGDHAQAVGFARRPIEQAILRTAVKPCEPPQLLTAGGTEVAVKVYEAELAQHGLVAGTQTRAQRAEQVARSHRGTSHSVGEVSSREAALTTRT